MRTPQTYGDGVVSSADHESRHRTSQPSSSFGDSGGGPALVADLAHVLVDLGM